MDLGINLVAAFIVFRGRDAMCFVEQYVFSLPEVSLENFVLKAAGDNRILRRARLFMGCTSK